MYRSISLRQPNRVFGFTVEACVSATAASLMLDVRGELGQDRQREAGFAVALEPAAREAGYAG